MPHGNLLPADFIVLFNSTGAYLRILDLNFEKMSKKEVFLVATVLMYACINLV